jgi:RNA polymerase sigma factor (sigma-70 family)
MLDFEHFYFNTKNAVYQYLYQHVKDFFETEDIAQETYLIALEDWEMLQEHPNPAGWLLQTAKNISKQYHRRVFYKMESIDSYSDYDVPYNETAYEQVLMEDVLERVYNKKELPIARKYFLQNDSLEELATELGVSIHSLRSRLFRMRRRMKSYIESGGKVW